jgi:hypothetical protein
LLIEAATRGTEVIRKGMEVDRAFSLGLRDVIVVELALAEELGLLGLFLFGHALDIVGQSRRLKRLRHGIAEVLQARWYATVQKQGQNRTMLPVD